MKMLNFARTSHALPNHTSHTSRFSLTPSFSWVRQRREKQNRFNDLPHHVQTVETVPTSPAWSPTPLKRGVNERASGPHSRACLTAALIALLAVASLNLNAQSGGTVTFGNNSSC